jgi:hypothetical protein
MTFICMIAWLIFGQDPVTLSPAVNDWATAFIICVACDLGIGGAN